MKIAITLLYADSGHKHTIGSPCSHNNTARSDERAGTHMHFFSCAEKQTQLHAENLLPTDGVVGSGGIKKMKSQGIFRFLLPSLPHVVL